MPYKHVTIEKTSPAAVKTTVLKTTPQELAKQEEADPVYDESWFNYYIPWHRDDEWWETYAGQKVVMDAENAALWSSPHRQFMVAVATGLLLGWVASRLL